ncbi:hypothetical protein B0H17DRAFT_920313, partial [Mycena rosella]
TILETINAQGWTFACFVYNIFRRRDDKGNPVQRSHVHAGMVSAFLNGRAKKTVAHVITEWMASADGRIPADSPDRDLMYSTTIPYTDIKPVRAAITSFSTQMIGKKVAQEAERAVQVTSGLHKHQPVSVYLCNNIAMRKPRVREGVVLVRKTRPPETVSVITHALAAMDFCRTDEVNLLPLARGILYFGSSAPSELMNYNSRVGSMPAPETIHRALTSLSEAEARAIFAHGADPDTAGFLFVDNTQNYHLQRDLRIGREHTMNVGMSGLWFEAPDVDITVFDLDAKRALIALNNRKAATIEDLLDLIDQEDCDFVGSLMFLEVLARLMEPLKPIRAEIKLRRAATAKAVVPPGASIVHPLACSGKEQTIPTELKDGMLDFLQQIGQTPEAYLKRKLPVGGDGLTYAMLLQLQTYLQFHDDPFKSFEILEPQLQVWHTKWTDIIRIFQTHWGRTSGKHTNPASLGFSAAKIGRAAPSNMKKVEFYQGSQLLSVILDAKILNIWSLAFNTDDIWAYFDEREKSRRLPDFEELFPIARRLYCAYATARGRDHALYDIGDTSEWSKTVPAGSPWVATEVESSSLEKVKTKSKKPPKAPKVSAKTGKVSKPRTPQEKPPPKQYEGDFVLCQEIDFIRDALNSCKISIAVAEGDIGRMYDCLKSMLFTFGGSTHTNYLNYLLEAILNFEVDSPPALKAALLRGLIWSLSELPDHCQEGDVIVEFFNRLLEDIVQHKSAQFDDKFIRNIVSRNLCHIAEIKVAWRTSTGMDDKSHTHTDAPVTAETRTLVKIYNTVELHKRQRRQQVDDRDTNNFAAAPQDSDSESGGSSSDESSDSSESETESDDNLEAGNHFATRGSTYVRDGELVFDNRDMMMGPSEYDIPEFEEEVTVGDENEGGLYDEPGGSEPESD